jgi:hypothetical protein
MSLSGFLPAASRRALVIGSIAAFVCAVSVSVLRAQGAAQASTPQTAAPQTPAAQAPPAQVPGTCPPVDPTKDPLSFNTEAPCLVIISLTPDGDQAFEQALTQAKTILASSAKPERKQQSAHWKVLKGATPDGNVALFFLLDATVKGASYNPFAIIYESLTDSHAPQADRDPVDALLKRVNVAIKGLTSFIYAPLMDMGGSGAH